MTKRIFKYLLLGILTVVTMNRIEGMKLGAFPHDFEIYDERSKDWSNAEVEIYISSN